MVPPCGVVVSGRFHDDPIQLGHGEYYFQVSGVFLLLFVLKV